MKNIVFVCLVCAISVFAQDSFENVGIRVALKTYDDCSKANGFSSCLKKKAITFLDRLSRMDKLSLSEGVTIKRATNIQTDEPAVTEEQLEVLLPRTTDGTDDALNSILLDKTAKFIGSRTLEITVPKLSAEDLGVAEGRKGSGGGGGGGGGKMKGGMMGGLMMGIAAKMAAMIPVAIAGLFLLAGKALITAKIALLLSGIIAIKKLFGSKQGGGGGGGGHGQGWQSSGHGGGGGGWQSGGGGWDKRSIDHQQMAYSAYSPK